MVSPAGPRIALNGRSRWSGSAGMKFSSTTSPVCGWKAMTRRLVESGTSSRPVVASWRRARAWAAGSGVGKTAGSGSGQT